MGNTVTQLVKIPSSFKVKLDKLAIDARSAVCKMLACRRCSETLIPRPLLEQVARLFQKSPETGVDDE
jgi:hypothetical protein